jgi:pyrroline-5-carboxylate reductase
MARIGFLGTGEITAAMVRGLQGQGHAILVSSRNAGVAARLAAEVPEVGVAANDKVVEGSDVVFLCLLARVADEILPGLPFRRDQTILSVMVDAPLEKLRQLCAPATDIAMTIPLPPIARGGCPLPVFPASSVLEQLFGDRNLVIALRDEAALTAHLGVSALCSPILDQMLAAAGWLTGFTNDRDAAEAYVTAMIRCYLSDRPAPGDLQHALQGLSTEGGLNATLRAAMAPARQDLLRGLDRFRTRLGLPEPQEAED